jgi:hypothetical protein
LVKDHSNNLEIVSRVLRVNQKKVIGVKYCGSAFHR